MITLSTMCIAWGPCVCRAGILLRSDRPKMSAKQLPLYWLTTMML